MRLLVPEIEVRLYRVHMAREDAADELVCCISPYDAKALSLKTADKIRIDTSFGRVIAKPLISDEIPKGLLFVPYHPLITQVIGVSKNAQKIMDHGIKTKIRVAD
ncbi:MAG: molybdopterin dinucleotide binding domain-containing protein [Candidatus Ranarchaeia archaeon]